MTRPPGESGDRAPPPGWHKGDQRAIDAATTPFRERASTPEGCEVGARHESDPPGADELVGRLGDDDRHRVRVCRPLGLEAVGEPSGPIVLPDRVLHRADAIEIGSRAHLPYRHVVGERHLADNLADRRDHDRLEVLGDEALRTQPLAQVGGSIVPVQLPLEGFATIGEHPNLSCDQLVELGALDPAQIAIPDSAAVPIAGESKQGTVAFNAEPFRQGIGHDRSQLGVVPGEQVGDIDLVHRCERYVLGNGATQGCTAPGLLRRGGNRPGRLGSDRTPDRRRPCRSR